MRRSAGRGHRLRALLLAMLFSGADAPVYAELTDEIQVYTDELTDRGRFGVELHVNTTPSGRSRPDFPGEVPPWHGLRVTPEISYGLGDTSDVGLYLPLARSADGSLYLPGWKVRYKWIPQAAPEDGSGAFYYGANFELSNLSRHYTESRWSSELRVIGGWRSEAWLAGINPILSWNWSGNTGDGNPQLELAFKLGRTIAPGIMLGAEYYGEVGSVHNPLPNDERSKVLYFALDVDRKPWVFNVGVGHGSTSASDRWTLKAIFELPFE